MFLEYLFTLQLSLSLDFTIHWNIIGLHRLCYCFMQGAYSKIGYSIFSRMTFWNFPLSILSWIIVLIADLYFIYSTAIFYFPKL